MCIELKLRLPGGKLRVGEDEEAGLLRKLRNKVCMYAIRFCDVVMQLDMYVCLSHVQF